MSVKRALIVYDVYEYDGVKDVVKYSARIGDHPCGDQFCVHHGRVGSGQTVVLGIGYVAVWLTGTSSAKTAIQQFWAKTTWVPTGDAAWFTRLAVVGESTR
jgi:hypothetical protein